MYVATLLIAMLLTGSALTLVAVQRANRRLSQNVARPRQASLLAQAGLERAFVLLESQSNWRDVWASGVAVTTTVTGLGTISSTLIDEIDGDLANDSSHPILVRAAATAGGITRTLEGAAWPATHPALDYAIMADGPLTIEAPNAIAGPVHSNSSIEAYTTVDARDNAAFQSVDGGWIDSHLQPQNRIDEPIPFPVPDLSFYTSQATKLTDGGDYFDLVGRVLTDTKNTKGAVNPRGVYWIDAGGRQVRIKWSRLRGTLIVTNTGGNRVRLVQPCWFEPGDYGYPVLLVDAPGVSVILDMGDGQLDEDDAEVDFNEDGDEDDVFAGGIAGLTWINASEVRLEGSWSLSGSLATNAPVHVFDGPFIDDDPALSDRLVPGFVSDDVYLVPGSIREVTP